MGSAYDVAVVVLQILILVGSSVALLHFGVLIVTSATAGEFARRSPDRPLRYAFLIPCLNEEPVIAATVQRLLDLPTDVTVWVIDDGSTDRTAAIVREVAHRDDRVRLVQRTPPEARQGKGRALNAGYRQLLRECEERGIDPASVVVCVMDADGLLDANAIEAVEGLFGNPRVGAAQIDVRIANRRSYIGRLQDVEFYVYASLMQQGRNHVGSVGLGGNGQFTRLAALQELGDAPWSDCLAEDLDLGLRLLFRDWKLAFTNRAAVHQEGLDDLRRLLRQRARWIQGHFQCWRHLPAVIQMNARWYTSADLLYHLIWPVFSCFVLPIALILSWFVIAYNLTKIEIGVWQWVAALAVGYVLAFATNYTLGFHYRAKARDISFRRTVVLIHLLAAYQIVWTVAGWWSVVRMIRGQRTWNKTERAVVPANPETA